MTYALEVPSRIRWGFYTASAFILAALCALAVQVHAPALSAPNGGAASPVPVTPKLERLAHSNPAQRVEVIVQLERSTSAEEAKRLVWRMQGQPTGELHIIRAISARMSAASAYELAQRDGVRAVSLNAKVDQKALDPSKLLTSFNHSTRAAELWDDPVTGKGVGVAVIDTGIAGSLADFKSSQSGSQSRVVATAVTNPYARYADDKYGHGTHVAGIIAGNSDSRPNSDSLKGKYAGGAPESNLISVKVSDDKGEATVLDVIYGLQFVVDHKDLYNIRVANLSLESTVAESYRTDPLDAAAEEAWFAGIVVVAAAGNRGNASDAVRYAPGNDPYVISVGGVDDMGTKSVSDDVLADWSSHGTTQDGFAKPEVTAPGAHIVSNLAPRSAFATLCKSCVVSGQYFRIGGTSMAAPMVAAAAADLLARYPGLTPNQVKGLLIKTARPISTQNGSSTGQAIQVTAALLQAGSATESANAGLTPSDAIDPATGTIDPTRSRWSRSRWSMASGTLDASYDKGSYTCDCSLTSDGSVDPARSRWSRSRWSASFTK